MKKIVTSAGLAALGVVSMQAAPADGLTPMQTTKPWSISASLRGFYDDNITQAPDNAFLKAQDSFGIQFTPSINYNVVRDQTRVSLGYEYNLRWYEDRDPDAADHGHRFNVDIKHDVSEKLSVSLGDEFTIAQEPEVIGSGAVTRARGDMDAIHNRAYLDFNVQLSRIYSLLVGYKNDIFNYDDSFFSARLDRVEHRASASLRAQMRPDTAGLLGYQFRYVDYTSDDVVGFVGTPPGALTALTSDFRNSTSHYLFAGVDHNFTTQLMGSLRAGAQFTSYGNAPAGVDDQTSPFVDANLSYTYAEGSSVSLGVKHERNQTDLPLYSTGAGTLGVFDQESTSVYASVSHKVTAKLTANVVGMYMNSSFGDSVSGLSEDFWSFGANLNYQINQFLSAEAGYNFDTLDSDVQSGGIETRSFDRNRVYLGLRASY